MIYTYYVTYKFQGGEGFAEVVRPKKIKNIEQIKVIAKQMEVNADIKKVKIENIVLLNRRFGTFIEKENTLDEI